MDSSVKQPCEPIRLVTEANKGSLETDDPFEKQVIYLLAITAPQHLLPNALIGAIKQ